MEINSPSPEQPIHQPAPLLPTSALAFNYFLHYLMKILIPYSLRYLYQAINLSDGNSFLRSLNSVSQPVSTARKRICRKVIFLHLSVILFTGVLSLAGGAILSRVIPWKGVLWRGILVRGCREGTSPSVNKQAIRILLECIHVKSTNMVRIVCNIRLISVTPADPTWWELDAIDILTRYYTLWMLKTCCETIYIYLSWYQRMLQ